MKSMIFILVIATCSLQATNTFFIENIQNAIKKNRIDLIKNFLQHSNLSEQQKQQLLECASQNLYTREAKLNNFSHTAGLMRKIFGIMGICEGELNILLGRLRGFIGITFGTWLYTWGTIAEQQKSIEGRIKRMKKYQDALTIKQLIEQTPSETPAQ